MINVRAKRQPQCSQRLWSPGRPCYLSDSCHVSSEGSLIRIIGSTHPTFVNDYLVSIKIHIWFTVIVNKNPLYCSVNYFKHSKNTIFSFPPKSNTFYFAQGNSMKRLGIFYFCFYFIQCSNKISLSVLSHKYVLQLTKNTLCKYFPSPWIFKLEIYFYPKSHKLLKMIKLYYSGNVTEINDNKIEIYPDLSSFFSSHLNWNITMVLLVKNWFSSASHYLGHFQTN